MMIKEKFVRWEKSLKFWRLLAKPDVLQYDWERVLVNTSINPPKLVAEQGIHAVPELSGLY
jgi:hypothetical protein